MSVVLPWQAVPQIAIRITIYYLILKKILVSKFVETFDSVDNVALEKRITNSYPDIIIDDLYEYVFNISTDQQKSILIQKLKTISMLHNDTLLLLKLFGKLSKKGILDLGAYVGGGSIAMALEASVPVIAVETGGSFVNQPSVPSKDILNDFIENIVQWDVDRKISLITGKSFEEINIKKIKLKLPEIDLLLIDSDGDIERDLNCYNDILVNKCIVVIDDYVSSDQKSKIVRAAVDKLVNKKRLEPFGVFMWGTWFGKYLKP